MIKRLTFCLLFVTLLSTVSFANKSDDNTGRDDKQRYHVYGNIELVSTLKFQYGRHPKIFVKSVYPQLSTDGKNVNVDEFNHLVLAFIKQEVTTFKEQAAQMPTHFSADRKNDLYIDYNASVVKSDESHIISIRFTIQGFLVGMAHPYHRHEVLNYDLDTGEKIELADLFKENSDYLKFLSYYSRHVLSRRLVDQQMLEEGTEPVAKNYKNWNIKPDGLLFTFDEYQVAPYVNGAQTVVVPYTLLKKWLSPDSPLADCISKKKCRRNNLLTGGFMDEA